MVAQNSKARLNGQTHNAEGEAARLLVKLLQALRDRGQHPTDEELTLLSINQREHVAEIIRSYDLIGPDGVIDGLETVAVMTNMPGFMAAASIMPRMTPGAFARAVVYAFRLGISPRIPPQWAGEWTAQLERLKHVYDEGGIAAFERCIIAFQRSETAFTQALAQAEEEEQEEKRDPHFCIDEHGKLVFTLETIEQVYQIPNARYLIHNVLEEAGVSLFYGEAGTGKTFTTLDMALCIVHGLTWHGYAISKSGEVWYINTEGKRGFKKRIKAWYLAHPGLHESPRFKIINWAPDLREHKQVFIDSIAGLPEANRPVLVVIDNFSRCTPGTKQNLQEEIAPILGYLHDEIVEPYGLHILLVHHTNKQDGFNGTQGFKNHVEVMMKLSKEDKDDQRSPITLISEKARDDEKFKPIRTELERVVVWADEDTGEDVTSCVIVETNKPAPKPTFTKLQQEIMDYLDDRGGVEVPRVEVMQQLGIESRTKEERTFNNAIAGLVDKGRIHEPRTEMQRTFYTVVIPTVTTY